MAAGKPNLQVSICQNREESEGKASKRVIKTIPQINKSHGPMYRGQLPPPDMLEAFERIEPGITNRMFLQVEQEGQHRRETEKIKVKAERQNGLIGVITGLLVVVLFIVLAFYVAYLGKPDILPELLGYPLIGIVAIFITGKIINKKKED